MDTLKEYTVQFTGLKEGIYTFNYLIEKNFFKCFKQSEIKRGNIQVDVQLDYKKQLLIFTFNLSGTVEVQCDRCLDYFQHPIAYEDKLFVKFGEYSSDVTDVDDTLILSYKETEISLAQHIYEYIILSLPYRRVHPDDTSGNSTCNKEVLKKLETYSKQENSAGTDPRWDQLKTILNN